MNKSDIKLILGLIILVILVSALMFIINIATVNGTKKALVYYDNDLILSIDLDDSEFREYKVSGYNGDVILNASNGKVRVVEEISPLHICSYQGWIDSPHEIIICLPNRIVVKIEEQKEKIDTIVR